jgi:TRAP transporter TAXI family solute receptor
MTGKLGTRWMMLSLWLVISLLLAACGGNQTGGQSGAAGAGQTTEESPAAETGQAGEESPAAETGQAAEETVPAEPVAGGEPIRQAFGGGPVGGAFQTFANGLSLIVADTAPNLEIAAEGTGGSVENLAGVDAGDFQYGIVYAADLFLGRQGQLTGDPTVYENACPIASLYGGVIHLVVSEGSGIQSVDDLPGKRIALGNAGSGAALSAERFFTHLGILDQVQTEYIGYSQAASAMGDGSIDGFWILAAFPNSSVTEATTYTPIRLIDVHTPAEENGFYEEFPFYAPRALTGGAYPGVDEDVPSFQDTAIWVANCDVPEELVYEAVQAVFSEEGLQRMSEAHPAAEEMQPEEGVQGIPVPLHPGAYRYWQEVGTEVPEEIRP